MTRVQGVFIVTFQFFLFLSLLFLSGGIISLNQYGTWHVLSIIGEELQEAEDSTLSPSLLSR